MKKITRILLVIFFSNGFICCKPDVKLKKEPFSKVEIQNIYVDSTLSIRALDFDANYVYFGSSKGYGKIALNKELKINISDFKIENNKNHYIYKHKNDDDKLLAFRAIKAVEGNLFALSIVSPARLYKLNRKAEGAKLVYEENHPNVFYDSINFWNENEGIAIGDPTDDCISIIITRDGGNTWSKLSCEELPKSKEGEAAFAASDTNIAIIGNDTWVATGGKASRILYSPDKGKSWQVFDTPITQGKETTGMYSVDFYDALNGYAIGGDYTKSNDTLNNKIRTKNGGKTWQVVANTTTPGYRSCVQYIPNSDAKGLVAVGFKGIDYSKDSGNSWAHLSDEGFYTLRFLNDSIAYAAGNGRISKLIFK